MHRDEADKIGGERRRLGADDALGKRVAVEQARRSKKRREPRRRQRAARQDEPGKRQDRERDRDLGTGQVDAGKVQARADGARGKEGERHQRGLRERRPEPRRKEPGRDREGEMVEADHRMGEAGEEALCQRLRRRPAHDVMGLGAHAGRGENQKR